MTIGEKIRAQREQSGMTQTELGKACGVTKQTIFKYETGVVTNIPLDKLMLISDALNVSAAYLMGWFDDPAETKAAPEPNEPVVKIYNRLNARGKDEYIRYGNYLVSQDEYRADESEFAKPEIRYIRHYLTAAAAGYAAPIEGSDYEMIPADAKTPANADFAIDITGDSMEPYIHDGERVYVSRDTSNLKEGDVGIFFVDGDVYCKQWCIDYVGTLHLLSANPKRVDANVQVHRNSTRNVVCFGKVILPKKLPMPEYF